MTHKDDPNHSEHISDNLETHKTDLVVSDDPFRPDPSEVMTDTIRVVAIGASAGGLEPIEQLFECMPIGSGLSFVVVQHLSPNFRSMMDQLIERHTNMRIVHAEDGMEIKPNVIYLNPPRTALSISNGHLNTQPYPATDTLSLPIDAFFDSLAKEAGSDAIGIVMSGTGSDGTVGSQEIIARGGTVIVQDPETAKFQSMPRKIIDADAASYVCDVTDIPDILEAVLSGTQLTEPDHSERPEEKADTKILALIQKSFGTDFRFYKNTTVNRRILRRALMQRYRNVEAYLERLQTDKEELDALYHDLLIGVTEFFRDTEAFDILKVRVLPELASVMSEDRQLRVWVPGCATGEEPYSIAILISEFAKRNGITPNVKIFATDIHFKSLDIAARGVYDKETLARMPDNLLESYFEPIENKYQVKKHLRRLIVFSQHNLIKDPPFTKIDIISCRNLLIYLNDVAQQKVMALFHFALRKEGVLFLGPSETVGSLDVEFSTIDKRWRIFSKIRDVHLRESAYLLPLEQKSRDGDTSFLKETRAESMSSARRDSRFRQTLYSAYDKVLERYAPTGLLVNRDGELLHVFGESDRFMRLRKGVFSNKVVDLVHEKLRLIVNTGIDRALSPTAQQSFTCSVNVDLEEGDESTISIKVEKLTPIGKKPEFLLITFEEKELTTQISPISGTIPLDIDQEAYYQHKIEELERELKSTGESLQNTIEELETSNEELQATNEELMASNEELQSTNEELHSVNEELYTVSAEHQRKISELTELTDDIENLLKSTQIGTLFLDSELNIRRFTPSANIAFNLLPHDIGRPLQHVTSRFPIEEMFDDIGEAISHGRSCNREIEIEDRTYLLSILPYRTEIGTITGAVVNIVDVHDLKVAQVGHAKEKEFYRTVIETQGDLIARFRPDTKLTFANHAFCNHFDVAEDQITDVDYVDLLPEHQKSEFRQELDRLSVEGEIDWEQKTIAKDGQVRWYHTHFHALTDVHNEVIEYQSVSRNVTELKEREQLMSDFNGIASDSERSLETRIEAIMRRLADYFDVPAALLARIENDQAVVAHMVGLENTDIHQGYKVRLPEAFFQSSRGENVGEPLQNFNLMRESWHPGLQEQGYNVVAGAPLFMGGKVEGALSFITTKKMELPNLSHIQPALDRIADWIGYEMNRQSQTKRLEELNHKLALEEERFRNLYRNTPVLMYSIDTDGRILEASNRYLSELGYTRDEVLGRRSSDFATEESRKIKTEKYLPEFWERGYNNNLPLQLRKKNGEVIDTLLSAIAHKDVDGSMRSMTVLVDVTDRLKAERELEAQNAELKKINDNLNQFAHIVSHDLAGPLRAIQHTAAWIEEDTKPEALQNVQDHLNRLKDQISHLGSLISDLTEYSKAGAAPKEVEVISLKETLEDIFEVIDKPQDLSLKLALDVDKVKTFRPPLMLVFRNLIENAVKYHNRDDGLISITAKNQRKKWVFEVADNGPGIDPKHHDKIMLPFRKLERKDKIPGNGMGLALVQKAVESIGGSITIRSNPAEMEGTTFIIEWPK